MIKNQKQLLEEHVEKLKTSEEELKDINATKDKFFSIIAHDLKNPFSAMIGWSDLFLKDKKYLNSDEMIPIMESLNSSANYGFSLLENLLKWAQCQTGAISSKPDKLRIKKTLENVIDGFGPIVSSKNIILKLETKNSPLVYADENMVATVLRNLIHNAVKFSYRDSVIKINCIIRDKYLVIGIKDQGVGISKKQIPKLFSIDDKTTKVGTNNEQGTGLGLILCKEFVEKNNGEIWAESLGQKGSVFSFSLPLLVEEITV